MASSLSLEAHELFENNQIQLGKDSLKGSCIEFQHDWNSLPDFSVSAILAKVVPPMLAKMFKHLNVPALHSYTNR